MSETPKNKGLKTTSAGTSSPAHRVDVYAGRPAQGHVGNLTGNSRVLKDTTADLFNLMQTWKTHQDKACIVISNIFNIRMQSPDVKYTDQLNVLVNELKSLCVQMSGVVKEAEMKEKNITALLALENGNSTIHFISWTTKHFAEIVAQIVSEYQKQQKLQERLLLKVADSMDSDTLLFCLSAWTYQPYLHHNTEKQLHYMIKETRHI